MNDTVQPNPKPEIYKTEKGPINADPERQPSAMEEAAEAVEGEAPTASAVKELPPYKHEEGFPALTEQFDRVFLINCAHRPDRLEEFRTEITHKKLGDLDKITIFPAVIGDYTTHPAGWGGGNGAWGCLQSHRRIMEDLMHERDARGDMSWDTALILEDDVFFTDKPLERLAALLKEVPPEWGQIYLGGQNRKPMGPVEGRKNVMKCNSVNRTHAYAIQRSSIQEIYRHISYMADYHSHKHIDHQLELAHQRGDWKVFGPPKWICGQRGGSSNISGQKTKDITWD